MILNLPLFQWRPTEGSGRRDGKEEEVIFNGNGLATYVAGPFLLKKRNQCL